MSDVAAQGHYPECIPHIPGDLRGDMCICDRLRACEDRVRMETQLECRLTPDDWRDAAEQAYAKGRADERAELWRLLEPLVTEMAMRNAGATP